MHTRPKKILATVAVMPVIASLAFVAAPSGAASNTQQTMSNGGFEHGRAGWAVGTARTKATVVKLGYHGGSAMQLTNRRSGPAILNSRSNVARSVKAGQHYTVTALVRTNQPGLHGRLVLRETANGRAVKNYREGVPRLPLLAPGHHEHDRTSRWYPAQRPVHRGPPEQEEGPARRQRRRAQGPLGGSTPTYPTPQPDRVAGKLTNGCAYSTRGIPSSCAAFLGSAYNSNTDPTSWESSMGQQLGVHRTYCGASQVDLGRQDGQDRPRRPPVPWISFKLPYSWGDMAAGKGDAWARDLATKLSQLDGPVWLAFHHEPEGDGDIKQWTAMQARLAPLVRSVAPNVAYSIVLTGWHEFFGDAQYKLDNIMPKNTKIDLLGLDVYNRYGAPTNGKIQTTRSNLDSDYFAPTSAWAKAHDMAWGVAESGLHRQGRRGRPDVDPADVQ